MEVLYNSVFEKISSWMNMPVFCLSTLDSMFAQMGSKFCEMLYVVVRG